MGATGQLIHAWTHDGARYRLVTRGKWNKGYADAVLLEKVEQDSLGDDRWVEVHEWTSTAAEQHFRDVIKPLVSCIRELKAKVGQGLPMCEP